MLLGLDADPYSYEDIADNLWPFNIRNKGKENEFIKFSTFSIRLSIGCSITGGHRSVHPSASSYDTHGSSTRVPETQAPADAKHERPRREFRPFYMFVVYICTLFFHL
jgi:hypothetical protein